MNILSRLFGRNPANSPERQVYDAIVAAARQPWFYETAAVPDTVIGRYDMISAHMIIVLEHLQQGDKASRSFARTLLEEMFRDIDRSLRELGVGDLSMHKRMKKLAGMFYGRADAYGAAYKLKGIAAKKAVADVVLRNVLAPQDAGDGKADDAIVAATPDSKEMQKNARLIAEKLLAWRQLVNQIAYNEIIAGHLDCAEK